jgi:hypothetical protein
MAKEELATPYIDSAVELTRSEVDSHVANTPIYYYGEIPDKHSKAEFSARNNFSERIVEDDSGKTAYSVLVSGDLRSAKRILIKAMSWSDHPGRDFEGLREALIADQDESVAVIGVSFPGAGLKSQRLNHKQKKSLQGVPGEHIGPLGPAWDIMREASALTAKQQESLASRGGDFSFIATQQWKAIRSAVEAELMESQRLEGIDKKISDYEFVISGSSQGASNAVGLLQAAPEDVRIAGLALFQDTGFERRHWAPFVVNYVIHGNEHFDDYTEANPYNDYPKLGPKHNPFINTVFRPGSHLTTAVAAMARGEDANHVARAHYERNLEDMAVLLGSAGYDKLSPPEANQKAELALRASGLALTRTVVWEGHYHPVMENLANARTAFKQAAQLS